MRLIDADALIEDIREHSASYFADDFAHEWVDQQPTIELRCEECEAFNKTRLLIPQPERKKGKWIEYDNSHCECPFCHEEWSYFDNEVEYFNFCPKCGEDLRGDDHDL